VAWRGVRRRRWSTWRSVTRARSSGRAGAHAHWACRCARGLVEGGDAGRELLAELQRRLKTLERSQSPLQLARWTSRTQNSRWTLDAAIDRPVIPGALARPRGDRRNFHGCLKPNHGVGVGVGVGDLKRLEDPNSISLAGR
jgi:hypothetical protein